MTETEYVNSRERAKQFRRDLKRTFPGTKFSVRCDTGTAWNWISVEWSDGPTQDEVSAMLRPQHKDLTVTRNYSPDTERAAAEILEAHYPELEIYSQHDGNINWSLNLHGTDINIGSKWVNPLTMTALIHDIAKHYVLGGAEQSPNVAEREAKQAALEEMDSDDQNVVEHAALSRGRLSRGNPFVLGMHKGEKPLLDVRRVHPFEAVLMAVPDLEEAPEPDLTPREVIALSPAGRPLPIFSVPALVMADVDGHQAGEVVWIGRTISTVLDQVKRVLVSRGDHLPLQPLTATFLTLL